MQENNYRYTILNVDGSKTELGRRGKMSLKELQEAVGGKIELLHYPFADQIKYRFSSVYDAYCNEEGKLEGLERNKHFRPNGDAFGSFQDFVVGPVIVEENMKPEYEAWLERQEVKYQLVVEVNDTPVFESTYGDIEDLYSEGRKPERRVEAELQTQFEDEYPEKETDE